MKAKKTISAMLSLLLAAACTLSGCSDSDSSAGKETQASDSSTPSLTLPEDSSQEASEAEEPSQAEESSAADSEADASADESADDSKPENTSGVTPAMWEITSPTGSKVIFMGSMHALKDEIYPLPDLIMDAYNSSDVLAVDGDIVEASDNFAIQLKQLNEMYYTDGSTFQDHLDPEVYEDFVGYAEACGFDLSFYKSCKLWVIATLADEMTMSQTDLKSDLGIDNNLLNMAHNDGKEIFEVESVEFQLDMFINFSDEICEAMLAGYSAENKDEMVQSLEDMYTAWKTGDLSAIEEMNDTEAYLKEMEDAGETVTEEDRQIIEEYNKIMLYDRNEGMKEKAEELINSGKNVFFVVGAAHFVGDKGLVKLLENDGYTLTPISP